MMALQAVLVLQPQWVQEVLKSYATNPQAQTLLTQLAIQTPMTKGSLWIMV